MSSRMRRFLTEPVAPPAVVRTRFSTLSHRSRTVQGGGGAAPPAAAAAHLCKTSFLTFVDLVLVAFPVVLCPGQVPSRGISRGSSGRDRGPGMRAARMRETAGLLVCFLGNSHNFSASDAQQPVQSRLKVREGPVETRAHHKREGGGR